MLPSAFEISGEVDTGATIDMVERASDEHTARTRDTLLLHAERAGVVTSRENGEGGSVKIDSETANPDPE